MEITPMSTLAQNDRHGRDIEMRADGEVAVDAG